jgi:hypothetical protein
LGNGKKRWKSLLVVIIITPFGFATKFYSGWGQLWIYNYAGDILYPIFWYFLILTLFPQLNPLILAILNFVAEVLIEFSQLYSNHIFETVRSYFLGKVVFGEGFDYCDFFYYILGNALGLGIYHIIGLKHDD